MNAIYQSIHQSLAAFESISMENLLMFLVPFLLAVFVDLKMHTGHKPVTILNASCWTVVWVACASLFGLYVIHAKGAEAGGAFFTGYALEKVLAIDNLFAFYLIFKSFGFTLDNTQHFQHKILYWGIIGAILTRIVFLGAGAFIVNFSPYILVAFALMVLWTVWGMWNSDDGDEEVDYTQHWSVRFVRRICKVNPSIASESFFSKGATPLFLCLVCIEICDVFFAFDSMPVIIAVVKDPYLMITASLWAAAGLRSLYFLLIAVQNKCWALDKAIMLLLVLVSFKLIGGAFGYHVSNVLSLSIVGSFILGGVAWSFLFDEPEEKKN